LEPTCAWTGASSPPSAANRSRSSTADADQDCGPVAGESRCRANPRPRTLSARPIAPARTRAAACRPSAPKPRVARRPRCSTCPSAHPCTILYWIVSACAEVRRRAHRCNCLGSSTLSSRTVSGVRCGHPGPGLDLRNTGARH
jgi:hypothetical protein